MILSTVEISMREDNPFNCSYAIITKDEIRIIIILRNCECAIYDYKELTGTKENCHYLLLKHYRSASCAYKDFLKLIGKMCKKHTDSKYFLRRKDEDNRIIFDNFESEHMMREDEKSIYEERFSDFQNFIRYYFNPHIRKEVNDEYTHQKSKH